MPDSSTYSRSVLSESVSAYDTIKIEYKSEIKTIPRVTDYRKFTHLVMHKFPEINMAVRSLESCKIDELFKFTYIDSD